MEKSYEIRGAVHYISEPEKLSKHKVSSLYKRILVLRTEEYLEVPINFTGNEMSMVSGLREGDLITVKFSLNSWSFVKDGKKNWFVSLNGEKVFRND